MSTSAVIAEVEEGHIASGLGNQGEIGKKSDCKKCETPWPCKAIEKARKVKQ